MLSLRRNGFVTERPSDIDVDGTHPIRLPGAFEMRSTDSQFLLFPTIVQTLAKKRLDLDEVYEQVWYHIHLGSLDLFEIATHARDFDEFFSALVREVPAGLQSPEGMAMSKGDDIGSLALSIGMDRNNENVLWKITDTATVENPHSCVIGLSGQGKTQFVLDLLYQLKEQNPDTSFTIVDYKGDLSEVGSASRRMFEGHLQCEVAVPGSSRIPAVPFHRSPSYDREQYALGITDLISRFYPQLGSQQRLALREVPSRWSCLATIPLMLFGFGGSGGASPSTL